MCRVHNSLTINRLLFFKHPNYLLIPIINKQVIINKAALLKPTKNEDGMVHQLSLKMLKYVL